MVDHDYDPTEPEEDDVIDDWTDDEGEGMAAMDNMWEATPNPHHRSLVYPPPSRPGSPIFDDTGFIEGSHTVGREPSQGVVKGAGSVLPIRGSQNETKREEVNPDTFTLDGTKPKQVKRSIPPDYNQPGPARPGEAAGFSPSNNKSQASSRDDRELDTTSPEIMHDANLSM